MGSFYRSKHELVFVFKVGNAPHTNTFGLGLCGSQFDPTWSRPEAAIHPTVKPVALVAEAIKDCSKRGGLVLDPFAGSSPSLPPIRPSFVRFAKGYRLILQNR
jgi:hypothetical protein